MSTHAEPGSHGGQKNSYARKRRRQKERMEAVRAEAGKLGISVPEFRRVQAKRSVAFMQNIAEQSARRLQEANEAASQRRSYDYY